MKNLLHSRSWFLKPDRGGRGTNLMAEIRKTPPFSGVPGHVKFKAADFHIGHDKDRAIHTLARTPAACAAVDKVLQSGEAFSLSDAQLPARYPLHTRLRSVPVSHLNNMARPTAFHLALEKRTLADFLKIFPSETAREASFRTVQRGAGDLPGEDREKLFCGSSPEEVEKTARYLQKTGMFKDAADAKAWWAEVPAKFRTSRTKKVYAGLLAGVKRRKTSTVKAADLIRGERG